MSRGYVPKFPRNTLAFSHTYHQYSAHWKCLKIWSPPGGFFKDRRVGAGALKLGSVEIWNMNMPPSTYIGQRGILLFFLLWKLPVFGISNLIFPTSFSGFEYGASRTQWGRGRCLCKSNVKHRMPRRLFIFAPNPSRVHQGREGEKKRARPTSEMQIPDGFPVRLAAIFPGVDDDFNLDSLYFIPELHRLKRMGSIRDAKIHRTF